MLFSPSTKGLCSMTFHQFETCSHNGGVASKWAPVKGTCNMASSSLWHNIGVLKIHSHLLRGHNCTGEGTAVVSTPSA